MRRAVPFLTLSAASVAAPQSCLATAARWKSYSAGVLDHYKNPRNVGKLDENDPDVGTGMKGAPECGDMLKLQVKVDPETSVITDVKFKAFGCGSAIAASSFASQAIRGKTLADALKLTNKDIAAELNLPPVKLHCSMLAEETIHAAVENYLARKPELKTKVMRQKSGGAPEATTSEAQQVQNAAAL